MPGLRREELAQLAGVSADYYSRLEQGRLGKVWTVPHGTMRLTHPVVGPLELAYEALPVPDAPEQVLITYSAEPGSSMAVALAALAADGVALGATGVGGGAE